jgi:indole-3-glycerol phosphate synthase
MILDEIVANKRSELAITREQVPLAYLEQRVRMQAAAKDFAAVLKGGNVRLIAEVKKASPSKGIISAGFDPVGIAGVYARHGAAAISVLTESKYFQGSLETLDHIGEALGEKRPPLLRKDFIFDPYQVYESRAHGADALLLVVAIIKQPHLRELIGLAHGLGMKCLVEVHSEAEVDTALETDARIIGINNRNLRTFAVDLGVTERLSPRIPRDRIIVSESGIRTRADVDRLQRWGVNAMLVGEALMAAPDIAARMKELL